MYGGGGSITKGWSVTQPASASGKAQTLNNQAAFETDRITASPDAAPY
jgi:hypothetical protein